MRRRARRGRPAAAERTGGPVVGSPVARNPVEGFPSRDPREGIRSDRPSTRSNRSSRTRAETRKRRFDASVRVDVSVRESAHRRRVSVHRRLPVTVDVRERAYECHLSERRRFASVSFPSRTSASPPARRAKRAAFGVPILLDDGAHDAENRRAERHEIFTHALVQRRDARYRLAE